jgi:hypothetical protein
MLVYICDKLIQNRHVIVLCYVFHGINTGRFLINLTPLRHCASRVPERSLLRSACEYCRWLSMPITFVHRSQEVLKMLSLYTQTFIAPAEDILIYLLKMNCRNIWNFPANVFFQFFFCSRVIPVNFVLQITPEKSLAPVSFNFSSLSTRRCFVLLSIKNPVVLSLFTRF